MGFSTLFSPSFIIGGKGLSLLGLLWALLPSLVYGEEVGYVSTIKPLLRDRCYACHGALKQEGGLRLDTAISIRSGGDSGPAIDLQSIDQSLLIRRVQAAEPAHRMPPEQEGEPLSPSQIESIREWIQRGGVGPIEEAPEADPMSHWSFQQIQRPSLSTSEERNAQNPIDALLEQHRKAKGLIPQREASRLTLLRRLYLDLIGLPPTPDEIDLALQISSSLHPDGDRQESDWYEKTVDRLLEDPRYGERWGRHWMDIWRYSDWWGLGDQLRNSQKHIWHWRDWIVESLNEDLPYDEMIRQMLAADELYPDDPKKLRATGYLARNYFLFNRPHWMEETVEHVSKGFLGLTMNCAKCHDHKYDPIRQTDFYQMRAIFEPYHVRLDRLPTESDLNRDGLPRVYDGLLEEPTYRYVRGDEKTPDKSEVMLPSIPKFLAFEPLQIEMVNLPEVAWEPERNPGVLDAFAIPIMNRLAEAEKKVNAFDKKASDSMSEEEIALELGVLQGAVELAKADLESLQLRTRAQKSSWSSQDASEQVADVERAIRAERQASLAKAKQELAVAKRNLAKVSKNKLGTTKKDKEEGKEPKKNGEEKQIAEAEKGLQLASEAVQKATEKSESPIEPSESFTKLRGAEWTATRFLNSGKDDPVVSFPKTSTGRRTALARWITDQRNPLTARVAVNHIWLRHMGQPLIPTLFDLGRKGTPPVQQELLDWLAAELMENRWSMKHLHRIIVHSQAYRMGSSTIGLESNESIDSGNQLWWRRVPIRLESQSIRDSILSLAGTLDPTIGGPTVPAQEQGSSKRRSLYFFHSNNDRNLFLTTFDEALVKDCYRREQSIVPQQSLALTNSGLVLDSSQAIAQRIWERMPNEERFIRMSFALILGIEAGSEEIAASQRAFDAWRRVPDGSEEKARSQFIWALINHHDFVTLR